MAEPAGSNEQWSSRTGFLLTAIGFSVGLGNIWRFPYLTGENGGSAFLIIYVLCAFGIGLPLLISELTIGRRGRAGSSGSLSAVALESGRSRRWGALGTLGVFCVFVILSYYTVLTGWCFDYFVRAAGGSFDDISNEASGAMFSGLMSNPLRLLFWTTVVYLLTVLIIRRGVQAGIEKANKILMPCLFVALVVMVIYGVVAGDIDAAIVFLLEPDFSKVGFRTVLIATGQAFFSIGIGMSAFITFGTYMPTEFSIPRSASIIILTDTGVALLAGFAVFPLVFLYGLEPSSGPGLLFQTLPVAFGQMTGGHLFGGIFFFLLIAAALTSCIGCAESIVNWLDERLGIRRQLAVVYLAAAAWLVGLLTVMSLGDWSDVRPLGFIPAFADKTIFDTMDFFAANILLLMAAALTSIFFGWLVPKQLKLDAMGVRDGMFFAFWRFMIRFVIPPILLVVLVKGLIE